MLEIPKRVPLEAQVQATIRKGLSEGLWNNLLPSERRLCEMLRVSRPVLRIALKQIAADGLIKICHGRGLEIVGRYNNVKPSRVKRVAIITHQPLALFPTMQYQGVTELVAHFSASQIACEILVCSSACNRTVY